jgi:hypothetical protein
VRDHLILRTEAATNNVTDYGVRKAVDNLSALRNTLSAINDNYLNVQQDIIETFIDRGQLGKLAHSRRYRLLPNGYSICLVFLKLFERVYAPLTAGLLSPVRADAKLSNQRRSQLDRLYQRIIDDLDALIHAVRLKAGLTHS